MGTGNSISRMTIEGATAVITGSKCKISGGVFRTTTRQSYLKILSGAQVINSVAEDGFGGIARFAGVDNYLEVVTGTIDTASAFSNGGAFYFGGTNDNEMIFSVTSVIKNCQAGLNGGLAYLSGQNNKFDMELSTINDVKSTGGIGGVMYSSGATSTLEITLKEIVATGFSSPTLGSFYALEMSGPAPTLTFVVSES
jgi:hypothetical protein